MEPVDPAIPQRPTPARGALAWMAQHPVTANLLMIVLLGGGLLSATRIKQEVFPNFTLDSVSIAIAYPGASPEEVERGIVMAVEDAVQGLEAVKEVTATAREGSASVIVEMIEGEDIQKLSQDIRNAVNRITSFPDEAEEPTINISSRKRYVISLALHGNQAERVLREYAEFIRDQLLSREEISQAELVQVRDYEISVDIPQAVLRTYGLTLAEVAARIRRSSVELPGGAIKTSGGDVLVRVSDRRDFGPEFGRIPIVTAPDGTQVLLEDIATITDGFEESDRLATYNGEPAVMLEVYRIGDQTPIEVAAVVRQMAAQLNQQLPQGLTITLHSDRSQIYRQRLDLMLRNGALGLCLVFLLLALFLEIRLAFWVSLGIPISFMGAILFLPSVDVSINMISMFAFIITLGIVVDDAIVAGENVYHHRQRGLPWLQAAVTGVREIAMPVTFSVLTNMITFLPLLFIPGFMGKIFKQIPIVVMAVFAISLVESLLILPAHLGHGKERAPRGPLASLFRAQQRFSRGFTRLVHQVYRPLLDAFIGMRYATLAGGVAIFAIVLGYVQSGRMGFDLFPKIESDYAMVTAELPFGSAVERTLAVKRRLVDAAHVVEAENGGKDLVEGIYARINGNETSVQIYLTPPGRRPLSTAEVTQLWQEQVGSIPGLESIRFESDAGGPGRGRALSIELSHRDMRILENASQELAEALSYFPQAADISDGFAPGKQQIDFQVTPEARSLGLRAEDIARQVRHAYYGATALRQQRGRNEV
ncbi:MAG: efflux RND transporter permease subunit, partial [Desulfobacterales bacterium]